MPPSAGAEELPHLHVQELVVFWCSVWIDVIHVPTTDPSDAISDAR